MTVQHRIEIDLDSLSPATRDFILREIEDCTRNDIQMWLASTPGIDLDPITKTQVNGYFNEATGEPDNLINMLACACGKPEAEWLRVFAHESSHKDQYLQKDPTWMALDGTSELKDPYSALDKWAAGLLELTPSQIDLCISIALNVELDCERRTVKKIVEQELPIDLHDYIIRANAYIYFWHVYKVAKQWYTIGKEPYNIPEILGIMPGHLDNDYTVIPDDIRNVILQYCYK